MERSGLLPLRLPSDTKEISRTRLTLRLRSNGTIATARQYDPTAFALRARDDVYCGAEALPFSVARCVVPKAINAMANKTSPFDHDAIDSAPQFYSCIGLS
jgi:hypothetical protein